MQYIKCYNEPADELSLFEKTYIAKLYEHKGYSLYLIANEDNPNDSPFIVIEHKDDMKGIECDIFTYDKPIVYEIIDHNVCYVKNLEEIRNNVQDICKIIIDLLEYRT